MPRMTGRMQPWRPYWSPDQSPRGNRHEKRRMKLKERRWFRRSLLPEEKLPSGLEDPSDCMHGCNGDCAVSGGERCNFTCHEKRDER